MKYLLLFVVALAGCTPSDNAKMVGNSGSGHIQRFEMPGGDRCYTYREGIHCLPPNQVR